MWHSSVEAPWATSHRPRKPVGWSPTADPRPVLLEWDVVTVLSVWAVLLFLIPARWVVGPLGGVGTPATLLGLIGILWRTAGGFHPKLGFAGGWQPVRVMLIVHAWFMALGWAIARMGPLTELETSNSTRRLLTLASLIGIALLAADGISSRRRFDVLIRRIVWLAGITAGIGLLQFFLNLDLNQFVRFPLLSVNGELRGLGTRSIFARPYGTSLHPIEFGAVLSIVLPVALHLFFVAGSTRDKWVYGALTAGIGLGIATSMSRTGILGAVIAIVMMSVTWTPRLRINAAIATITAVAATWVLVPGLVGTLRRLILGALGDPSIESRIERIPRVMDYVEEAPIWGRGYGVFTVDEYLLLDNQVYEIAIESGLVGVVVVAVTYLVAAGTARGVRYRAIDADTRHLAQAIAASIVVSGVSLMTFSAFFYRIFMGVTFLFFGLAGALWRLEARPIWADRLALRRSQPVRGNGSDRVVLRRLLNYPQRRPSERVLWWGLDDQSTGTDTATPSGGSQAESPER